MEQANEGDGAYVQMLRKVEKRLATRLPKLGIARHDAVIGSYKPPMLNVEILDNDRPGWGPHETFRLTCPIPQQLLDLVVGGGVRVGLVVREQAVVDVRVHVGNDEASLPSLKADSVKLLDHGGARMLLWA